MDIPIKKALIYSIILFTLIAKTVCAQLKHDRPVDAYSKSIQDGFKVKDELTPIYDLWDKGDTRKAVALLNKIIAKPDGAILPIAKRNWLKGSAYYTRGLVYEEEGRYDNATADYETACRYGHPYAPYRAGSRYIVDDGRRDLPKSLQYFLMGAILGDRTCMDMVTVAFRAKHQKYDENYWGMLFHISDKDSLKMVRFFGIYRDVLTESDRLLEDTVIQKLSISGGQVAGTPKLPGRSTTTAAYVDYYLRRMLGFTWLAFFDQTGRTKPFPMSTVFHGFKKDSEGVNPGVSVYLEGNSRYGSIPESIPIPVKTLIAKLLPGDEILVNCGGLSHYSIIWSVDRAKNKVLLLDPFYEFWQTTHNNCVSQFKQVDYLYKRKLIEVNLDSFNNMLVAVFSIRDKASSKN